MGFPAEIFMTIKEYIKKSDWQYECETKPCRYMNVDVNFLNNEKAEDETQFSIRAYDVEELDQLFNDFCKENGFNRNTVTCIAIVQMAETMDELD